MFTSGNNTIHYIYDGFGQLLQVNLNGTMVKKCAYKDNCNYTTTSSESDYDYEEQTVPAGSNSTYSQKVIYNADGMPLNKQEKTGSGNYSNIVTTTYAASDSGEYKAGELQSTTDSTSGSALTQTFTYDSSTRQPNKATYSGARTGSIANTVSKGGKLLNKSITFGDTITYDYNYSVSNSYTPIGSCANISFGTNKVLSNSTLTYNSLEKVDGRIICTSTTLGPDTQILKDKYNYSMDNKTITGISHFTENSTVCVTENYEYDKRKNIASYTDITSNTHSYRYDEAGRLIRENNIRLGFTKTYTYNGGNIATVTVYGYTTANNPTGGMTYIYNYQPTDTRGRSKVSFVTIIKSSLCN